MQMNPAKQLFLYTTRNPCGRALLCNLSETPMDAHFTSFVRAPIDKFMELLLARMCDGSRLSWPRCITLRPSDVPFLLAGRYAAVIDSVHQNSDGRIRCLYTERALKRGVEQPPVEHELLLDFAAAPEVSFVVDSIIYEINMGSVETPEPHMQLIDQASAFEWRSDLRQFFCKDVEAAQRAQWCCMFCRVSVHAASRFSHLISAHLLPLLEPYRHQFPDSAAHLSLDSSVAAFSSNLLASVPVPHSRTHRLLVDLYRAWQLQLSSSPRRQR